MKELAIILIALLVFSCSENKNSKEEDELNNQAQFILQDSIMVDYVGNLYLTDYNEKLNSYLAMDDHTIVQFNEDGEISSQFTIDHNGPQGIANRIDGLAYYSDSSVIVNSAKSFYFYNFQGELINTIKLGDGLMVRSNHRYKIALLQELIITLMMRDSEYRSTQKEYYEQTKNFTVYNQAKDSSYMKIPYEEESVYRNGEYFFINQSPYFHLNKTDTLLYVIYHSDPTIYIYDPLNDFKKVKIIDVLPDYFGQPTKIPYGQEPDFVKSLAFDAGFHNIFSSGDLIIAEYKTATPGTFPVPSSFEELNKQATEYFKLAYSIFKNGKKLGQDIKVPEGKFGLVHLNKEGNVIFQLDKRMDERNYEVFYKYTIDY